MGLISPLRYLFRGRAVSGQTPEEYRRRYRDLYEAAVEPAPDGGATFGRGRLWRRGGVNVLRLAGDPFEMAFQHGRLLEAEIARGTVQQTSVLVRNAIRNSFGGGLLSCLANWYAGRCISEPILHSGLAYLGNSAEQTLAEIYGLSESCRIPVRTILRGVLGPETAQVLLGLTEANVGGGGAHCTSFAAWGSATSSGEMIIGRNTDYPLNGYFDNSPTVIYFERTGGWPRYMTVTSAGSHLPGVSGMNEHGIFVCVHTVPTCSVSERGIPVFLLGQEILRRARTLDEAAALVQAARPAAGWNYHVISARERKAFTVELCQAAVDLRHSNSDVSITTNHWTQPATLPHLMTAISTFTADSHARAKRAQALLDAAHGTLNAAAAAAILGDAIDPESGRPRCFPNTIAANHTVSSSVWCPDAHTVYVGAGGAPTSQGRFVAMPTSDALDPETFGQSPVEFLEPAPVGAEAPGLAEARQMLIAARIAFEYQNDAPAAADLLACAATRYSDPALDLSWALMAVRAGRFQVAAVPIERTLAQDWDLPRAAIARYLRGRIAADRGDAEAARADFQAVIADTHADARLLAAARTAERKLGNRTRLRLRPVEIVPMGWLPDAFRYLGVL